MGRATTLKRRDRKVDEPAVAPAVDDEWIASDGDKVHIKPEAARSKKYQADGVEVFSSCVSDATV